MKTKETKNSHDFYFKATGIGSVPSLDIEGTCRTILEKFPAIPFWPQFVKSTHLEDMSIQFSEGLPLLRIDDENKKLILKPGNMEDELVEFYDHYLSDDIDYFAISREHSAGLYRIIEQICEAPQKYGPYIKGHTVGPFTFASGIVDRDGKSVLYNPDLMETFANGLAIKTWWQAGQLEKSGKESIIFLDEPALSGFGSAFSPIDRLEVVKILKGVIDYLKGKTDTLIGIHCCGNTDWSMILEADPHIVSFDAFGFMDFFLLYPEEIIHFIKNGGIIAWGIVPTSGATGKETIDELYLRLLKGLENLHDQGLEPELIYSNSILTPACGMGSMDEASALGIMELLAGLSEKMRNKCEIKKRL
ncbi:MAG: hypothetical protein JW882_20100 [Deltaproteobacteria bacterium]|nr:hypothetical protein [Deltaproteobacteria bacterium]